MSEHVTVDIVDHIATITLDRPPVNALDRATMREIISAFDRVGGQRDVRAVVLAARGKTFCAGSDIKARNDTASAPGDETEYNRLARSLNDAVADCAVPVIAAVDGAALGGGLCLVAASDIVVASPRATFGLPEITVGLLGGASWATRLFGERWARRMMLTGERFTMEELGGAEKFGALSADDPLGHAQGVARGVASKSPAALRLAKRALNDIEFMELRAAYRHEQGFTARLRDHPDSREAMSAFTEHRPARFSDNER